MVPALFTLAIATCSTFEYHRLAVQEILRDDKQFRVLSASLIRDDMAFSLFLLGQTVTFSWFTSIDTCATTDKLL